LLITKNKPPKTNTDQIILYGWSAESHGEKGSVHSDHDDRSFYKLNIYPSSDASQYAVTIFSNQSNKNRTCAKSMVNLVALVKPMISMPIFLEALVQADHAIHGAHLHD